MISFADITKLFSFDLEGKWCIEIEFRVKDYRRYQSCWMGKTPNKADKDKDLYWFGLVPDCSEAYDYDHFQDLSAAPVFCGKSLKDVWSKVEILSIDGVNPEDRIRSYLEWVNSG